MTRMPTPLDRAALVSAAYLATSAGRLRAAELAAILRLERVEADPTGRLPPHSWEVLIAMVASSTGHSDRAMGRAFTQLVWLGWIECAPGEPLRLALPRAEHAHFTRHLDEHARPTPRAARKIVGTRGAS